MLDVSVNPATARARLVWDPPKVRLGDLLRVLEHVGLRPHPLAGEPSEQLALLERRDALKRLAVAGFGNMQVMMFAVPLYFGEASGMDPAMREYMRLVSMLVSIPVALYSGWPFYQGAWHALRARSISMDVPVSLGIVLAFVASVWNALTGHGEVYFDSVTMFVFFLGARALHRDDRAPPGRQRGRRARAPRPDDRPARARAASPRTCRPWNSRSATSSWCAPARCSPRTAIVLEGDGRVDESMLTGESTAIAKAAGRARPPGHAQPRRAAARARHGRGRQHGAVRHRRAARAGAGRAAAAREGRRPRRGVVPRPHPDRRRARVRGVVVRRPVARLPRDAGRAGGHLPLRAVARHADGTGRGHGGARAARRAGRAHRRDRDAVEGDARAVGQDRHADQGPGARRGRARLRRGDEPAGARLGRLARATVRAPDRPRVRRVRRTDRACERGRGPRRAAVSRARSRGGGCASARAPLRRVARRDARCGGHRCRVEAAADESWVYLGDATGLLAAFRLTDPLAPRGGPVRGAAWRRSGLPSEIVSGDEADGRGAHRRSAAASSATPRASPRRTSSSALKALQDGGAVVVAVGDGINDAPLLRGADVAVAMGRGSALAQTSADLILVRESLDDLPHTIALARRTQRVIRQNLGLVDRLQPRRAAAGRARPGAAVARGHRHVAELGGGRAERDAPVARHGAACAAPAGRCTRGAEAA